MSLIKPMPLIKEWLTNVKPNASPLTKQRRLYYLAGYHSNLKKPQNSSMKVSFLINQISD